MESTVYHADMAARVSCLYADASHISSCAISLSVKGWGHIKIAHDDVAVLISTEQSCREMLCQKPRNRLLS